MSIMNGGSGQRAVAPLKAPNLHLVVHIFFPRVICCVAPTVCFKGINRPLFPHLFISREYSESGEHAGDHHQGITTVDLVESHFFAVVRQGCFPALFLFQQI